MSGSLKKNISWTFLGNVIFSFAQWGIIVVLARMGGKAVVGEFALALAITAPIMIFCNLGLRLVQATDANDEYKFSDYLSLRLITSTLGLITIIIVAICADYEGNLILVCLAVGLSKAVESISDIFYGLSQRHERMKMMGISLIIRGICGLVAICLGYLFFKSLVVSLFLMVFIWLMVLIFYDIKKARSFTVNIKLFENLIKTSGNKHLKLIFLSMPLGLTTMLASLNTNIPRYFIEHYLGLENLGLFAVVAYFIVAGRMIIMAIGQAVTPRLAKYYHEDKLDQFKCLLYKIVFIGAACGCAGIFIAFFFGPYILTTFYGDSFLASKNIFTLIMVVACFNYVASLLNNALTATRILRHQALMMITVVVSTSISSIFLVPKYGLSGAACAMIIGALTQLGISFALLYRKIGKATNCQSMQSQEWTDEVNY